MRNRSYAGVEIQTLEPAQTEQAVKTEDTPAP